MNVRILTPHSIEKFRYAEKRKTQLKTCLKQFLLIGGNVLELC